MSDFVLSKLLRGYAADGGFTGSSMGKAIQAAESLETRYYHGICDYRDDDDASFRRLSELLRYMQGGWGWTKDEMEMAARWAEKLEILIAGTAE